jgi:hypothetical protein
VREASERNNIYKFRKLVDLSASLVGKTNKQQANLE